MRYITKTSSLLMAFMLIFQLVGTPIYAIASASDNDEKETAIVHAEEKEEVPIFEDESNSSNIIQTVENGTEVTILDSTEEFSHIEFLALDSSELSKGYISSHYLTFATDIDNSVEESESDLEKPSKDPTDESEYDDSEDKSKTDDSSKKDDDNEGGTDTEDSTVNNTNGHDSTIENSGENSDDIDVTNKNHNSLKRTVKKQETLNGIGIKNPTNVREKNSTTSNVITSYPQGTIIKLETFSDDWYEVTVNVNGKNSIGYVHHKHVEEINETQENIDVVGLRNPTNVRKLASTKSQIETSYPEGTTIKVKTFSKDWYEVTDEGKTLGYIHHKHVGDIKNEQILFQGIGIKSPTNIRKLASTKSDIVTSLSIGTIIDLETFSDSWYEVTANIDGKVVEGYIHHKHIGDKVEKSQEEFKGIGIKNPTNIRTLPSTKANTITQLPIGSIINLESFSEHWYKATVNVNGKQTTGYVHKKHIGDQVDSSQKSFKGIGINGPTRVRELPSTKARNVTSLPVGTVINLKTFSENWYEATVNVNGKQTTGYIHKKHIGDQVETKQSSFQGIGIKDPTHIRVRPSTQAESSGSLQAGTIINLKTFSKHWYEATVNVGGKDVSGYIHKHHFNKVNGSQEELYGEAVKNPTIIRSLPSTNAKVVKKAKKGELINLVDFSKYWYKATLTDSGLTWTGYVHKKHVNINTDKIITRVTQYKDFKDAVNAQMKQSPQVSGIGGGFVDASREQVEYYINPSNFNRISNAYYQFLVLSKPAGLNANEVNKKVLNNSGVLKNKASSFIKAAKQFNINEAYLISHAKLETGNGTSKLAKGVPVDKNGKIVAKNKAYTTVYNVYGIGAVDSNALAGGAKRAFDEGWTTVDKAIVGGAQFINTYIVRGQDTLYKMKWNPESPGYPQYATDIGWAVKQTVSIAKIYDLVDDYTLIFDVPKYKNQPNKSGNPDAYYQTRLEVTASALNIRENAGTQYKSIGQASKGTKLLPSLNSKGELVTKKANGHVWYRISYEGKTAWASGGKNGTELVKIINK